MYSHDNRVVITLDAAARTSCSGPCRPTDSSWSPSPCLRMPKTSTNALRRWSKGSGPSSRLSEKPVAISFAFPGPADYPNGIIGGYLPNFRRSATAWRWSVPRSDVRHPGLHQQRRRPVRLRRALGGALPQVNARLEALNSPKRYKNLVGYTFSTGFGVGIVVDNRLNRGDNSCVETFCLRHKKMPEIIVEEGVAVRANEARLRRAVERSRITDWSQDICDIADGKTPGQRRGGPAGFRRDGRDRRRRHGHGRDADRRSDRHRRRHHGGPQMDHAEPAEELRSKMHTHSRATN